MKSLYAKKGTHSGLLLMATVLCLGVFGSRQALSRNSNPGIIPPNASYGGMTYGQWNANYLYFGLTGEGIGRPNNVQFLPLKNYFDPTSSFDVVVPAGNAIAVMVFWDFK